MEKRLLRELQLIKDLQKQNIYYFLSENNITKGKAILFGPPDTPYEYVPLEFLIEIPDEYPFVPPKVTYNTNDGFTRFHPNLYVDGKVCLSILGTYSGPKWASSLNISSVLLSILSILTKNPLSHEPGYENFNENHPKCSQYSDYVEHNLIQLFFKFYESYKKVDNEEFQKQLEENREKLIQKVLKKAEYHEVLYTLLPYGKNGQTSWKKLAKQIKN